MDKNDQIALEKASRQIHTKNLRNIFEKEIFSDFTIHTKDEDFKAHKSILSGRSVYFYQYLKEKNINEIKIQINSETMKQILNFIYTDEIEFNSSNILDIYKYSTIFQLHSLLTEIVKKLDEFIDETNVFKIFQESENFSSSKLKDSCINFIYSELKKSQDVDGDDEQKQKTAEILNNPDILELSKQQITDLSKKLIEENQYFIQIIQILFNWTQHQIEKNPLEKLKYEKDFENLMDEMIKNLSESSVKDIKSKFEAKKGLEKFIKFPDEIIYKIMSKINQFEIRKLNDDLDKEKDDNEKKVNKIKNQKEEIKKKEMEIEKQKKEIENREGKIQLSMKEIENLRQEIAKNAQNSNLKSTRMFLRSEIIENEEEDQQLQKWVDDNEFLTKMKLGLSLKDLDSSNKEFYEKVNDKGRTLILVKTTENYIFGAYTTVGFQSNKNNEFTKDPKAFLFSLKNPDKEPTQFSILPGKDQYALYSNAKKGPCFGGNGRAPVDLIFNSNLKSGVTNIGYTYGIGDEIKLYSNDSRTYLAGSSNRWEVKIFETYFV